MVQRICFKFFVCVSSCTSPLIFVLFNTADHFFVFICFITKQKHSEMGAMCHIPFFREPLFIDRTNHLTCGMVTAILCPYYLTRQ